ncbi:hypothetical protein [Paenibacillus sp. FSL K6-2859]|uniref:hypothetical protein n=1 Tax=Paenibacillus sp. FSL K6-2859 TaxID=2921482 RepID=UPI0030FAC99F
MAKIIAITDTTPKEKIKINSGVIYFRIVAIPSIFYFLNDSARQYLASAGYTKTPMKGGDLD